MPSSKGRNVGPSLGEDALSRTQVQNTDTSEPEHQPGAFRITGPGASTTLGENDEAASFHDTEMATLEQAATPPSAPVDAEIVPEGDTVVEGEPMGKASTEEPAHTCWIATGIAGLILVASVTVAIILGLRKNGESPPFQSDRPSPPPGVTLEPSSSPTQFPTLTPVAWKSAANITKSAFEHGFSSTSYRHEQFGSIVALSSDASLLIVGSPAASYKEDFVGLTAIHWAGAIYTYKRIGTSRSWTQLETNLYGSDNSDYFGSVATLSGNDEILVVGARRYVRVYQLMDQLSLTWQQLGRDILPRSAVTSTAKWSVSVSFDGSLIALGESGADQGRVRLVQLQGGQWIDIQEIIGDYSFGTSVSLSDNRSLLAVGEPWHDGNAKINSGRVWFFSFNGMEWVQSGNAVFGDTAGDFLGHRLRLSGDGQTLAVTANGEEFDGNPNYVRVMRKSGENNTEWLQVGDLFGEDVDESFGQSLALSIDGSVLVVGAPRHSGTDYESGALYVFRDSGVRYQQIGYFSGKRGNLQIGWAVALSDDGETVVGGPDDSSASLYEMVDD